MPQRYYRSLENLHIGCEEPRAYFIPFNKGELTDSAFDDLFCRRELSSRFTLLDGEWDFAYFENVEELEPESNGFSSSVICRDKMTVPYCWQLKTGCGYDVPNYINQDYPYPVDPPYLPDAIPCGFYRRSINIKKQANKKYFINFEGVSSCFYLYINGSFAGYSQVSHCTSEFNVTQKLINGKNTVEVLVIKHCTGSYMEDQDFFRLSGIFRSVYILERDSSYIKDIFIKNSVTDDLSKAEIKAEILCDGEIDLNYTLLEPDKTVAAKGSAQGDFFVSVNNPVLWNPEQPQLYTLIITAGDEEMYFSVGLKLLQIKNSTFLLNNRKLKLKGINRHDSNPETGYAVTTDDMLNDLKILKGGNVNTIRTSHYPNDPRFAEMCDKLGFMLIDEADLESHGMGYNYGDWYWDYWAYLCNAPEWKESCLDRARRLFERDKNHAAVIMWSLGNESGCGENHRCMANYIRARMPGAVVHYENAHLEYSARLNKDFSDISDVESRMYASLDYLRDYLNNPEYTKPFFYCEYVSSTSTGDIPLHWNEFEKHDKYTGGCVWEFCDHAVNIGTKAAPKYRYGGDFSDYPNDRYGCVDGIVYPNRSLRPGFYDMKITYQPFFAEYKDGSITVTNKRMFADLSEFSLVWRYECNGKAILRGSIQSLCIAPGESETYVLTQNVPQAKGTVTLILSLVQSAESSTVSAGFEAGHMQFVLNNEPVKLEENKNNPLSVSENSKDICVTCGGTKYVFSKIYGKITSVNNGKELLCGGIGFSVSRSSKRSDYRSTWLRARFEHAAQKTYSTEIIKSLPDSVVIKSNISFSAPAMPPAVRAAAIYEFCSNNTLKISIKATVTENAPVLPRFGISLAIPHEFSNMQYFGYGANESYCDRYKSTLLSLYSTTVSQNFEHLIVPDECSAHYNTKYAQLTDNNGFGFAFADCAEKGFVFSAKHYSDSQLDSALHDDELYDENKVYVNLDFKMQADNPGLANIEPERMFNEKSFEFSYVLMPICGQ